MWFLPAFRPVDIYQFPLSRRFLFLFFTAMCSLVSVTLQAIYITSGFSLFFPFLFGEITCNLPLNLTSVPLSPYIFAISSSFFFPCSISSFLYFLLPTCGSQTQRSGNGAPQRGLAAQAVRRALLAEWRAPGRQACS